MSTIQKLQQMIKDGVKEINVNFINAPTPTIAKRIMRILHDAGYVSDSPGCPQQTFSIQEGA